MIGLGDRQSYLSVYTINRPDLPYYQTLETISAIKPGEIYNIAEQTGNHWRKVFNVYAKLCFELNPADFPDWQTLRDNHLLQANSQTALLFSVPETCLTKAKNDIRIIMGKTYAQSLNLPYTFTWLSEYFAINEKEKMIICPYFDYRQLSNIKIQQLVGLIRHLS